MSKWDYTNERVLFWMVLNGDFEWVCSTITSQNIYGRAPTIILLTMRPSRLFVKIRCHAVASTRKSSAVRNPKLPSFIKAGYLNCRIRPYIPNPLRCFKCQRFGHSQTSCRGQLTCSRCASVGHASTDCSLEPKCINCLQPHPSDSKICPKWKIEKQIQEIKTTKNISYPEARKLIVPQLSQTYAQAAKSSTLNNSTQTDENIIKINCPPLKLLAPLSSKQRTNIPSAITTSSSAQTQLLPSISSKTSTISNPQPPTPMSETKGKIKEQPSPLHRPRKDNKKNRLIKYKT
ncbi:RNA-directed DNA polymerase from mobile element jockey [Trichonephila clavipes]|nr:RNA-directed DNA polymerase from mobile element jockey [Trichonephila clavipes]